MRLFISIFAFFVVSAFAPFAFADEPQLQTGDIIFHTSSSKQSYAIMWASKTLYSHVGIVEVDGEKKFVLEAIGTVSRTPLANWVARGRLNRYAVVRRTQLSAEQAKKVVSSAKKKIGKKYDIYFTSKNDEIYCSELVHLAYADAGIEVGKVERVKELDFDNALVRKLVEKRWKKHPVCKAVATFEECWKLILEDELVTPVSIANDQTLERVWSNYPL
ncbi:MAG: YiiX/YebB-like N1pC/P60 family cysteine hydrolase [Bdellovibrionota bacterium]